MLDNLPKWCTMDEDVLEETFEAEETEEWFEEEDEAPYQYN